MAAYLDGHHHPQQALAPRVGFIATDGERVIGYVAGHLTQRLGSDAELQYLYVAPEFRRQGVAGSLLRLLSRWFVQLGALKVCVNVDAESPAATSFYVSYGATPLSKHWYIWDNIRVVLSKPRVDDGVEPSA